VWWGGSHPYHGVLVWSDHSNRWHSPRDRQSSILSQSFSSGTFTFFVGVVPNPPLHSSIAYRKTRPQSENLGPGAKVSHDTYQMLVSTSNPVRKEPYEVQISHHNLPIKKRALQVGLKRHIKGGQRFKQAYIQKKISPINLAARVKYGEKYQHETIESF
jgi:hypothetical protein